MQSHISLEFPSLLAEKESFYEQKQHAFDFTDGNRSVYFGSGSLLHHRPKASAASHVPSRAAATGLGGVNLRGYCQSLGYANVTTVGSTV